MMHMTTLCFRDGIRLETIGKLRVALQTDGGLSTRWKQIHFTYSPISNSSLKLILIGFPLHILNMKHWNCLPVICYILSLEISVHIYLWIKNIIGVTKAYINVEVAWTHRNTNSSLLAIALSLILNYVVMVF